MNGIKRFWVACRRFRGRHGYGVHPPFAFQLITDTLYSHPAYYALEDLARYRRKAVRSLPHLAPDEDACLFRLVNRFQPMTMVQVGTGNGLSALYMERAHRKAHCLTLDKVCHKEVATLLSRSSVTYRSLPEQGASLESTGPIDFLHLAHTEAYAEVLQEAMGHFHPQSFCLIEGIRSSKRKLAWWRVVTKDPRVGVSFDLYNRGLLFFDTSKPKQHYNA